MPISSITSFVTKVEKKFVFTEENQDIESLDYYFLIFLIRSFFCQKINSIKFSKISIKNLKASGKNEI